MQITLKRRPRWKRFLLWPGLWLFGYRFMYPRLGRWQAFVEAGRMSSLVWRL